MLEKIMAGMAGFVTAYRDEQSRQDAALIEEATQAIIEAEPRLPPELQPSEIRRITVDFETGKVTIALNTTMGRRRQVETLISDTMDFVNGRNGFSETFKRTLQLNLQLNGAFLCDVSEATPYTPLTVLGADRRFVGSPNKFEKKYGLDFSIGFHFDYPDIAVSQVMEKST